jgi:Uma2 family endonuclease
MHYRPAAGVWTYQDLFSLPDDDRRYEIIEGELFKLPTPTTAHATVIANVITMLIPIVAKLSGRMFTAPVDVFFLGIREYWLLDPEAGTFEILLLDGDAFHRVVSASGADVPVSPLLGPLPVTADDLFTGIPT